MIPVTSAIAVCIRSTSKPKHWITIGVKSVPIVGIVNTFVLKPPTLVLFLAHLEPKSQVPHLASRHKIHSAKTRAV